MSSRFSRFKKKVFEAMVVSLGRSSSIMSIKGDERWNFLCGGFKKQVMNTRRKCCVTTQSLIHQIHDPLP
ncbi:BnaA06g02100D [Brassica napus]|uniref:BnaA06g02100D protein n=2 Tax=Brassica TaxID=3705 RepID=A0A078GCU4_BRANA|nr:BnaA06g02100D [Brassica napus]